MLTAFCLRLACGLVGCLLLLSPAQVNPRFYRTHFLTALGLAGLAAVFLREAAEVWLWVTLGAGLFFCFLGALTWSLERAPGGRSLIPLAALALGAALALTTGGGTSEPGRGWALAVEFSSAALLGAALSAMLMGHSYLIAPAMSLTPLLRLLGALLAALVVRAAIAGAGLWFWTRGTSLATLKEMMLFLPLRWVLGFGGPLVLGVMAWETARIRSTQSATGILYVVVILCFLGELLGQLLFQITKGGLIP